MSIFSSRLFGAVLAVQLVSSFSALAEVRPEKVRVAENRKTKAYLKDGMFVGGDKAIQNVLITDVRRALNPEFERIVLDVAGVRAVDPVEIARAPYYQVAVSPDEKRLIVSIFGKPSLEFNTQKIHALFKKSKLITKLDLLPKVEENSWTFAIELRKGYSAEVFELARPVRIIIDIRNQ